MIWLSQNDLWESFYYLVKFYNLLSTMGPMSKRLPKVLATHEFTYACHYSELHRYGTDSLNPSNCVKLIFRNIYFSTLCLKCSLVLIKRFKQKSYFQTLKESNNVPSKRNVDVDKFTCAPCKYIYLIPSRSRYLMFNSNIFFLNYWSILLFWI